jgi:hypothetical protein
MCLELAVVEGKEIVHTEVSLGQLGEELFLIGDPVMSTRIAFAAA